MNLFMLAVVLFILGVVFWFWHKLYETEDQVQFCIHCGECIHTGKCTRTGHPVADRKKQ